MSTLSSDHRNVINWAKAVTRALHKWQRKPTVENQDKLLDMTIRLAKQVENLEESELIEAGFYNNKKATQDNVIQFRKRPRKP
jgi:hypothetical protein